MDSVSQNGVDMIWWVTWFDGLVKEMIQKSGRVKLRLISPGTGRIRSPIVHSPLVPALPPIGGLPPTSTTLKTSTSS